MEEVVNARENLTPRNLLTHFDETLAAMQQLETAEWLREQLAERETRDDPTIFNALQWLASPGKARTSFVVLGWGGVNRWVVRCDGSVSFYLSELMKAGTPESAARAEELGFSVVQHTRGSAD